MIDDRKVEPEVAPAPTHDIMEVGAAAVVGIMAIILTYVASDTVRQIAVVTATKKIK